ncbi:MAG: PQQ-binding-like beta-propeller repeat protein [Thermoguttaceae bacterium]
MFRSLVVSSLVATLFVVSPFVRGDWPMFNGVNGDNRSTETGLLKTWPEGGPKLLWKGEGIGKSSKPTGYGGVTVVDGRVFVTGNVDRAEKEATATIYCLDEKTGKEIWQAEIGDGWMGHFEGDRSTPTVDGKFVYAFAARGELACFEAATGKLVWKRSLTTDFDAALPGWAYAESVKIDGDKVIVCPGGKKASVVALDKATGKDVWVAPPVIGDGDDAERGAYATGMIFTMNGRRVYVNMNQKGVIFVDPTDGKLLGHYRHETAYDVNATPPHYEDGAVIVSSGYGTTGIEKIKLTLNGDVMTFEQAWVTKKLDNAHGGLVFLDGYVYGSADKYKGGALVCLKVADGEEAWNASDVKKGSITFADGMLYTYSENEGHVALVKATPEKFEELARFQIPEGGRGNTWAHPVISNGKLFLRHDTTVYCFDVKTK